MVTDSPRILDRWRKNFSQLFNVHGVCDVRKKEVQIEEPLVPEPSAFKVETVIGKAKRHKSPGIDQIPAEMFKVGRRTIHCEILKHIISIWNKEELPEVWKDSIMYLPKRRAKKHIVATIVISLLPITYKILSNVLLSRVIPYAGKIIGDHQCGF